MFDRWGLRPQTPKAAPSLRISGNVPALCRCKRLIDYASESLINTILDAGKTKERFMLLI